MTAALLKELVHNQTHSGLQSFNDEGVRLAIDEIRRLYDEVGEIRRILDVSDNVALKAKLYILKLQLKRDKRVLLAYQMDRLLRLSRRLTDSTDFSQASMLSLSKAETKFYHIQADNIVRYKSAFGHHINIFGPIMPPKDYYIQVRVEQDCGTIQTEYGKILLTRGTLHFLKRNDVEHLIVKGLLTHVI